jgi:hypothetical protein
VNLVATRASGQPAQVARALLRVHVRALIWLWVGLIVIFNGIAVGVAIFGHLDRSIWETSFDGVGQYFPLAVGIGLMSLHLPVFVAHGVTRRNFGVGSLWFVLVFTLISAVGLTLGYVVEDLIFAIAHRTPVLHSPQLFTATDQFAVIFGQSVLQVLAYLVSGWLIGAGFRRFGVYGLLLLIPGLLPIAGLGALIRTGWLGQLANSLGLGTPGVAAGVGVQALLIVLGAAGAVVLGHGVATAGVKTQQPNRVGM